MESSFELGTAVLGALILIGLLFGIATFIPKSMITEEVKEIYSKLLIAYVNMMPIMVIITMISLAVLIYKK